MKTFLITVLVIFQCTALFAEPVRVGTTFSPLQCEYLDLDWKGTYLEVLEMGFDLIRLGAYWNEIEKEEGIYDFSRLDWQIKKARAKGVPVVLTVGMKAPRWPEYFIPGWILGKSGPAFGANLAKDQYLGERTLKFIEETVNRYRKDTIIRYWQVENEPLNRIGEGYWYIGKDFLKQEVDLVRELDGRKRPIVLTTATYPNGFLRFISRIFTPHDPITECLSLCDILGLNVYPVVGHRFWGMDLYFRTKRKEREEYFSALVRLVEKKEKEAWVVELQAEPWEPGQLVHKHAGPAVTASPDAARESFEEMKTLGFHTIFLWGVEYWLFRKTSHGDNSWHEMFRTLPRAT